jgi:hypothetical protein
MPAVICDTVKPIKLAISKHKLPKGISMYFRRSTWAKPVPAIVIMILAAALCNAARADEKRAESAAQNSRISYDSANLKRKDFNFFGFKAWVNHEGIWSIDGNVSHKGLLCGTYEVGMRFGAGTEGCNEVKWITTDQYLTSEMQCNNATVNHHGMYTEKALADHFDEITCAERVIRCTGTCK